MTWQPILDIQGNYNGGSPQPVPNDQIGASYVTDPIARELLRAILVELRVISTVLANDQGQSTLADDLDGLRASLTSTVTLYNDQG